MSKYIGFGRLSHFYNNILYSVLVKLISDIILGFQNIYPDPDGDNSIFKIYPVLGKHILIQHLYKYFGFIFFSSIMYLCSNKKNKKINNDISEINKTSSNTESSLIYNKEEEEPNSDFNYHKFILFCFLYFLYFETYTILYYLGLYYYDLWVFNIVFITFFMITLLKKPLFKHQLFSLGFIFFTNIISTILINRVYGNNDKKTVKDLFGN